jgi:hypothetical protein
MKIILTRSNFVIVLAGLLFFSGCKKEKKPENEEIKPQKIKSFIPRYPFRKVSKANFTYLEDGTLQKVDLNTPFSEHDRLDYTNPNGQTKIIAHNLHQSQRQRDGICAGCGTLLFSK